jgi:peptidoglycan/xylan/chitin deacetylase (PgdA/CDA1 family)
MKLSNFFYSRYNPIPWIIPVQLMIRLSGHKILCVFYHSISDRTPDHIKNIYNSKSLREFNKDIIFLLRHYRPIDLFQLKRAIYEGEIKKNFFFVSFDDGLSEFFYNAAPILLKNGISATCFLNNNFIDNKDIFYRYKISLLIEGFNQLSGKNSLMKQFDLFKRQFHLNGENREILLKMKYSDNDMINKIAKFIGIDFNSYLREQKPYMTSAQISELINQGFTFGGHSWDHPKFSEISDNQQLYQSLQSTNDICKRFNLPYKVFSFPFSDINVNQKVLNNLYKNEICLTFGTNGLTRERINYHLQRLPMEGYFKSGELRIRNAYFRSLLKLISIKPLEHLPKV